jgi:hypothetical protein
MRYYISRQEQHAYMIKHPRLKTDFKFAKINSKAAATYKLLGTSEIEKELKNILRGEPIGTLLVHENLKDTDELTTSGWKHPEWPGYNIV